MKTEVTKKTVEQKVTIYICEYCGDRSPNSYDIKDCERMHKQKECEKKGQHSWKYDIEAGSVWEDELEVEAIGRYCTHCSKTQRMIIDHDDLVSLLQNRLDEVWANIKKQTEHEEDD